ncbi:MAG: hypothetical protein A3H34_01145 [Betaproteobacteria bacterium RIFCSPLOWO2_02_FULL_67_19]|nr:MAG: hypothetical protein A3H34_01145 [Betaproteobacteria bacterium RIFCSPLOWO2_02_FULL_67_19]
MEGPGVVTEQDLEGLRAWTHVIYALHAISVFAGLTSAMFVVTAFVTGWPSIIAVLLNYLKRSQAAGTLLESHFRWQIRTFWWTLLWGAIALLLIATVLGVVFAVPLLLLVGAWVTYRIARGWLALLRGKAMPS